MRLRLLCAIEIGLLLLAGASTQGIVRAEDFYAKVELKGRVRRDGPAPFLVPMLDVGDKSFELDMRRGKAAPTEKELERLAGRLVIVHGTLRLRDARGPLVVVTKLTVVPEKSE